MCAYTANTVRASSPRYSATSFTGVPNRSHVGDGAKIRADAFGNINYAVMLATYGVTEDVALAASHAPGPDVGYGGPSTYDDAAIRLGYQLVSTYPDGFSESTYSEFILENLDSLK